MKLAILISLTLLIFIFMVAPAISQVIAVGGNNEDQFLPLLVQKAGGTAAHIYIIAAARLTKEDQHTTIESYTKDFISLGVSKENISGDIILTKEDADSEIVKSHISTATAICSSGGRQPLLSKRVIGTKLHKNILKRISAGAYYYGNSAGTAAIGDLMIADEENGKIIIEKGLGIIQGTVFEQHYTERQRSWRLKQFLEQYPQYNAIGIDERTAVIIEKDKRKFIGKGKGHELALK